MQPLPTAERWKWRGYLTPDGNLSASTPLTFEAITLYVKGWSDDLLNPDFPRINARVVDVEISRVIVKTPTGKINYKVPYSEIVAADTVIRQLLEKGVAPDTGKFRDPPDGIAVKAIAHNSYAPALAARIRAAELESPELMDVLAIKTSARAATMKKALISACMGQGKFRSQVLQHWGHRCAVTGSVTVAVVKASHIKPWRDSSDEERLDPKNGIPLVAHFDALFDKGLISFDDRGRMLVSSQLSTSERKIFGLSNKRLQDVPTLRMAKYLAYHRLKYGFHS